MGKERSRDRRESKDSEKRRERDREGDREIERREKKDREREKNKENGRDDHGKSGRKEKDRERDRDREEHKSRKDRSRDEVKEPEKEPSKEEKEQQEAVEASKESTKEIEERIARMREARVKERAKKKDVDDVRSWVDKSRKLDKEKEKEKQKRLTIVEQEDEDEEEEHDNQNSAYGAKDLAGMKIRHGLDQVMEGREVYLTLKDVNIISGDDVNEDADELENVNIAEQSRREEAYKSSKIKPGIFEDKFQNDINTLKTVLPQYDDAVKDEGIEIDETGGVNEDSQKKLEEVRHKLQGAALKVESLLGPAKTASDFYTQEEMMKFKKPKKVKKIRKKDKLDIDALEAEAKAEGMDAEDHGSRSNIAKAPQGAVPATNMRNYQSAFAKALEASKALRGHNDTSVPEEVEEDEIFTRLKKSRELAIKKRAEFAPEKIAARVKQEAQEMDDGGTAAERTVVITETEEFCLSLQPDEAISRRVAANDAFGDDEEAPQPAVQVKQEERSDERNAPVKMEIDNDTVADEPPIKEVNVGKGLAGALKLLQERGSLKETVEWGGRNMDKKPSKLIGVLDDEEAPQREINLDRRDEYGRTLTPKEAFRTLSHKFHGKGPGKTKQEKKMKQHQEELKQKQMTAGDTPLRSMEKMREVQARTSSPYIVVSGHIKPGQTSDPRSGFATVEKDPVGSLTPMLGDKKAEHLLKRPADMKPPLPKKKQKI